MDAAAVLGSGKRFSCRAARIAGARQRSECRQTETQEEATVQTTVPRPAVWRRWVRWYVRSLREWAHLSTGRLRLPSWPDSVSIRVLLTVLNLRVGDVCRSFSKRM